MRVSRRPRSTTGLLGLSYIHIGGVMSVGYKWS